VATAEAAADLALGLEPGGALVRFRWDCGQLFGIPQEDIDEMVERAILGAAMFANMLDIEALRIDPQEVLDRAREALLQLTLESERENAQLQAERERLATEAATDPLTGLSNRRHLQEFLGEQYRISSRYGTPLSVLLIDIDHFKLVNDEHGHPAGDQVLREVALALRETCRQADLCARYGGEEFVVVLPATALEGALELAERLRRAIEGRALLAGNTTLSVTVSVGVTAYRSGGQANAGWLIKEADLAMYEAKAAGRNTVRQFEEAEPLSAWSIAS
jgi:diguanylate cyclase (GGDEF)-like protein